MSDDRPLIAVIGASGAQGGAVVRALVDRGTYRVRALTRNPDRYAGDADEVVEADLSRPETLAAAFEGAYGAFVVTAFWEPGSTRSRTAARRLLRRRLLVCSTSCGRRCPTSTP